MRSLDLDSYPTSVMTTMVKRANTPEAAERPRTCVSESILLVTFCAWIKHARQLQVTCALLLWLNVDQMADESLLTESTPI